MSITQSHRLLILLTISLSVSVSISERKVGGRTAVANVEANREVQDLGRYCVEQYNRSGRSPDLLSFSGVVAAERQVVAGIKYYLTIVTEGGRAFDAVVVVKPWAEVRELVSFKPSASARYWKIEQ